MGKPIPVKPEIRGRTRAWTVRRGLCAATLGLYASSVATAGDKVERLVFTQVPVSFTGDLPSPQTATDWETELPLGTRIVTREPGADGISVKNLTPSFAIAGRPDPSFDGKRLLFIGKRAASDRFNVWEMDLASGDVRPITGSVTLPESPAGFADVTSAIYLSTIFTLDAERPVYQIAFAARTRDVSVYSLYTCRMDGTRLRRITFDPGGLSDPHLLSDGRLLYSRWLGVRGTGPIPAAPAATDWMTVNTDGTDVFVFAAAHEPKATRSMACETPGGRVIYVESTENALDRGGSLVAVSRSRSLHTRRVIAHDANGLYHSPFALADGKLLVSYRPTVGGSYGVFLLDPDTGTRISKVYDAPQWHDIDAIVPYPRREPDGRSSVVDDQAEYGFLYCMDAYSSDLEKAETIKHGQIHRLRIFGAPADRAGNPQDATVRRKATSPGNTPAEKLLGEVPVEPDGSFFLKVPARTPLRLATLDSDGRVLQRMTSWIWVMPKEARGCIGCHEDRELTPPNRHVQALREAPYVIRLDHHGGKIPVAKREYLQSLPE